MAVTPEQAQEYIDNGWWTADRIGALIGTRAQQFPDRELFSFHDQRVTYGQFDAWVTRIAVDLMRHGVQPGERVMVQLPNCLEALALQVAAFRIGALDVPVIPIYREHETTQILSDARPSVIAVSAQLGSRTPHHEINAVLDELGQRPKLRYLVGGLAAGWNSVPALDASPLSEPFTLPEPTEADRPAVILYTSGTTSAPKGALLSSRALFAHLRNMSIMADLDEHTVIATGTPLSHLSGFVAGLLLPAYLGARSVVLPGWQPDVAVGVIAAEKVTTMMGATVFLQDLVTRYAAGAGAAHRLCQYMCAGSTIPPELIHAAVEMGIFATRNYGMTETAGICTGSTPDDPPDHRAHWDGRLLPGMQIQAVDPDRHPQPDGIEGELRIRGPQLFDRYTDTAVTTAQFDDQGWFYPGDIGVLDNGWVRMTGRSKDIVNRGGEKFSTHDIELALLSHPDIVSVAVTAVPDDRFGETVGAWVVLADHIEWHGAAPYLDHLEELRLAKAKRPVEWHVVAAIPTTASGKVQKYRLRELTDLASTIGAHPSSTASTEGTPL